MPNTSDLAKKLNLKDGMSVHVIGKPNVVDLEDIAVTASPDAEGVIDAVWSALRFRPGK